MRSNIGVYKIHASIGMFFCFMFLNLFSCKNGEPKKETNAHIQQRPNVLFIAIDDLNDWVGCLKGHPQVKTPNIDRLAASGTLFTNAHTQSPICNPSRTSILTGLRPSTTGIYGLSPWIRDVEELKDIVTLPQYFANNGYRTLSAGKIYHAGFGRRESDNEFQELGPPSGVLKTPEKKLIGNTPFGNHPLMDWGTFDLEETETSDYQVADWAVGKLREKFNEPVFLSVGFFLPHVPLYIPPEWYKKYPEDSLILPPILKDDRADTPKSSWYNHWKVPEPRLKWLEENGQLKNLVRSYLAAISFVDHQLGKVLNALEKSELSNNTIIVLWSDHGYHLGEKAISGKNTLWERSTRVPLIFSGMGIGTGKRVDAPVELLDIYPTLNELCGLKTKPNLEGHSLVPQLQKAETTRNWPAITTNNVNNHCIRTEKWSYIKYADGSEELYNLDEDSNEWYNLINSERGRTTADSLAQWLPKTNHEPYIGNGLRVLNYKNGQPIWEGEEISPQDQIPGI